MKRHLPLLLFLLTGCDTAPDYSVCPVAPYGKHDFIMSIYHDTYHWEKCKYCDLSIRIDPTSDIVIVDIPGEPKALELPKTTFYPE